MSLTEQLIELIESKSIEDEDISGASWFVLDAIANIASEVNATVENIGARRLHTIMEKLLEEISFTASDIGPTSINIDTEYVEKNLGELIKSQDLSKFIL